MPDAGIQFGDYPVSRANPCPACGRKVPMRPSQEGLRPVCWTCLGPTNDDGVPLEAPRVEG